MNNMNTRCDDFDFDTLEVQLRNRSTVEDKILLNDMKERKIFLNDEIDAATVETACQMILRYNAMDKGLMPEERKPIYLYLDTYGGGVEAGFRLINTIMASKTEVRTVCFGFSYSMGFLIFIAGHKRYAAPYTRFLMHDGSLCVSGTPSKAQDQLEFNKRSESMIKDFVCSRTSISTKTYNKNATKEWYMFADDAKKNSVVDYIVGVDCDINEVV